MSAEYQRTFSVSIPRERQRPIDPVDAIRFQPSLESIIDIGERLQRDAMALMERAAFDGEEIASASVTAELRFASEEERSRFLNAYLNAVSSSVNRPTARSGAPYRVILAAYPATEGKEKEE
ncbi:MAG TPA: hypothetical protein VJN32_00390 [Dehalococcoidia bacterium]|nr:hypothetical protein [Dehalococcoidia bacterium]